MSWVLSFSVDFGTSVEELGFWEFVFSLDALFSEEGGVEEFSFVLPPACVSLLVRFPGRVLTRYRRSSLSRRFVCV